jgi:hypothetical protein
VFHSVNDLITAIEDYLEANNGNPKPFVWTATAALNKFTDRVNVLKAPGG